MHPLFLCVLLLAYGGGQNPPRRAAPEGILPPWEAQKVLGETQKQTRQLIEALNRLDTEHWKGDYTPLLVSTRQRMVAVADALDRLAQQPERVSLGMEAYLSLLHVETNMETLATGAERFQPSAVQGLEEATVSFLKTRDQFQNYLLDLARYLEKNLAVSAKELESCRDQLWKKPPQPAPPRPRTRKM